MALELQVWLFTDPVGTLNWVDGGLSFSYAADWLSHRDAVTLSVSLPLQTATFDEHQARPFFAGVLPEGAMRRLIEQQLQVSRQNDFALLGHIGGECAGAVTFLRPGQAFPMFDPQPNVQWLGEQQVVALLDELPRRPMLAGQDGLRLSLAGAQDKLPVVFDGQRIGLPLNGTPSTHILKPAIYAIPDSVVNEGFCMALAALMQLTPAPSYIHRVLGRKFLLVERYDRLIDAQGHLRRLHQEDFCQALGVVPEAKYQNEGGPDLVQCFELVRRVTHPWSPQVLKLLDIVIFNALIGNHDAHAKNFSLLYTNQAPILAPSYDLLSTTVYSTLSRKMAMKIGDKYVFSEVQARHWERFAQSVGLNKSQAKQRILQQALALPIAARQLQSSSEHDFAGSAVVDDICALIEQRCAQTVRRLN